MRVIGVSGEGGYGGPEALKIFELADRHAGPGEVRLAVHAAAVNPTDTYTRNGSRHELLKDLAPPYVPGMDVAGIVDEIGPDTRTDLRVGDRAMAIVIPKGQHGGYSDSLVLPADSVTNAPAGAKLVEAATLPMNGLTARKVLDMLALPSGSTLAVTGAAGAFGGYVVQLARADGLTVVADASEADEEMVRSLGAHVIVRRGDDVATRIRAVVPEGVDAVADGAVQHGLVLPAIRDGGALGRSGPSPGPPSATSPSTPCGCASTPPSEPSSIASASKPRRAWSPSGSRPSTRPARPPRPIAGSRRAAPAAGSSFSSATNPERTVPAPPNPTISSVSPHDRARRGAGRRAPDEPRSAPVRRCRRDQARAGRLPGRRPRAHPPGARGPAPVGDPGASWRAGLHAEERAEVHPAMGAHGAVVGRELEARGELRAVQRPAHAAVVRQPAGRGVPPHARARRSTRPHDPPRPRPRSARHRRVLSGGSRGYGRARGPAQASACTAA